MIFGTSVNVFRHAFVLEKPLKHKQCKKEFQHVESP